MSEWLALTAPPGAARERSQPRHRRTQNLRQERSPALPPTPFGPSQTCSITGRQARSHRPRTRPLIAAIRAQIGCVIPPPAGGLPSRPALPAGAPSASPRARRMRELSSCWSSGDARRRRLCLATDQPDATSPAQLARPSADSRWASCGCAGPASGTGCSRPVSTCRGQRTTRRGVRMWRESAVAPTSGRL